MSYIHISLSTYLESKIEFQKKSTDSMILYTNLKELFGDHIIVDRPYDSLFETIDVRIKDSNITDMILKQIEINKWYIAKRHSETNFEIKPIYSKGIVSEVPNILYHATPSDNLDNINLNGILPKTNDVRHKYPPRIYVCDNLSTLNRLIIEMKRWKDGKEFSIIEIDTTDLEIDLYKDLSSLYKGCYYIQDIDCIPPYNIKIIK